MIRFLALRTGTRLSDGGERMNTLYRDFAGPGRSTVIVYFDDIREQLQMLGFLSYDGYGKPQTTTFAAQLRGADS
jgi:hypothetical protein